MQCNQTSDHPQNDPKQPHLPQMRLGAVWEESIEPQRASERDLRPLDAEPSSSIDLPIRNPAASEFFKPGKKYYVTFTEAPGQVAYSA